MVEVPGLGSGCPGSISVTDKCTTDESGNPVLDDYNKKSIDIHNPAKVSIADSTINDPTCLDPGNGKILLDADDSETNKYIYRIKNSNDQLIEELVNQTNKYQNSKLKNGENKIVVLDNERPYSPGDSINFTLNKPQVIELNKTSIIPPGCPGENGTIGLVANGESLSFEYILKDANKKEIRRNKTVFFIFV